MKQTKPKRKFLIGRLIDILIIPIYIIIAAIFLYGVNTYTSKYFIPIAAILLILLALNVVVMFYKKKGLDYFRRIIVVLLCGAMIFANTKISSFNSFFSEITDNEDQYITTQMNLYSLQSNEYFTAVVNNYQDIEGKTIGIQTLSDEKASNKVIAELKKDFNSIEVKEYNDYSNMMSDLTNGYIDVAVMNTARQEGLEVTFGAFADFTTSLKSYTFKEKLVLDTNDLDITKDFFAVYISGTDEVGVPADSSLSDMNMLVLINPTTHQIITASIPRDSYLPNPALQYENDKLTHTGWEGVDNTVKAVENAFDIEIDFSIKVSFTSLIEIIDALDGIEVDIPIAIEEQDENRSFEAQDLIRLNPGVQTVNGKQALAFARHRYGYVDGDLGRNRAQVQIVKSIIKKLVTPDGITKIDAVLDVIPKYVLLNFSSSQLKSFVKEQIDTMPNWQVSTLSLSDITDENEAITASAPNVYAYACYLSQTQVEAIHTAFTLMKKGSTFQEFSFELDSLYLNMIEFNPPENVILK